MQGIFAGYAANKAKSYFNKKKPQDAGVKSPTQTNTQQGQAWKNTPTNQYQSSNVYGPPKPKNLPYKDTPTPPTTEEQPKQPSYISGINDRNNRVDQRFQDQVQFFQRANQVQQGQQDRQFQEAQRRLDEQVPEIEKRSKDTQDLIRKGLESAKGQAVAGKEEIGEQAGETLRNQAQSKREVDSRRNQIFAGNNTTDSYGVGGYQLEQTNADTEFLREQNKTLRERDRRLADVDNQVVQLEITAQQAINDEVGKFNDLIRQIQNAKYDNELKRREDVENAYIDLQKTLYDISDRYEQNKSALDELKFGLDLEYEKLGQPDAEGESKLRQEYLTRTEKSGFPDIYASYNKILNSQDTAAGDMSMIFAYMKMLDPGSVVREGEFANAQNTAGIPDRVRAAYNNALRGERLAPEQRKNFKSEAENIFANARRQQDIIDSYYGDQASQGKYDPYNVTGLYGSYQGASQGDSGNSDPLGLFTR